jgi:hypothetical protein
VQRHVLPVTDGGLVSWVRPCLTSLW